MHKEPKWIEAYQVREGEHLSRETEFQKGHVPWHTGKKIAQRVIKTCKTCGIQFEKYLSDLKLPNRGIYCSKKCWTKGHSGKGNINWKPIEYKEELRKLRKSTEMKKWTMKVLVRDNFTCQECGSTDNFNAHHKIGVAGNRELALDLSNGVTLCVKCHAKKHDNKLFKKN